VYGCQVLFDGPAILEKSIAVMTRSRVLVLRTEFIRKRQAMAAEELFLLGYAVAKLNDIASIIRISEL
jgi:hypothetical protein